MRIQWTSRERTLIAEEIMKIEAVEPNTPFSVRMARAQMILPSDRRRNIPSIQAVPWLSEEKHHIRMENERMAKKPLPPVEKPEPVPVKSDLDILVDKLLEKLPDLLIDRLVERLASKAVAEVAKPEPVSEVPVLSEVREKRERLAKVVVLGPLPIQAQELSSEFAGLLNLRFWKDQGTTQLKDLVKTSRLVVIMADKISHAAQNIAKRSMRPDAELAIVSGGVSNLKVALEKYAVEKV